MNNRIKKELDNIIDNWDSNTQRSYELMSKINNWGHRKTVEIQNLYRDKLEKSDLFYKLIFSNLYQCKKTNNLLLIRYKIIKVKTSKNSSEFSRFELKFQFSIMCFIKLLYKENYGPNDVMYNEERYRVHNCSNLMKYKFNNYGKSFNIDVALNSISEIDLDNLEFKDFDSLEFETLLDKDMYIYDFNVNENGEMENDRKEIFKEYTDYKRKTSKKNELLEKMKKN